jgi:NADPH-dependent 2,4-dienoyl-CoA reductase/sulfur reductase-like enzyme
MPEPFRVAVVGAGPAGLAAAAHAAAGGLSVVLIDAGAQPGGQYWRHPDPSLGDSERDRHHDWTTFAALSGALGPVHYLPRTQVALVERGRPFRLHLTPVSADAAPGPDVVTATDLILCPGGYDRQLPVPGWNLPGVMAAGGVQALLNGFGTRPGNRAVIAGTGPFLLPVASAFAAAGGQVVAVCEANSPVRWARQVHRAAQAPGKAREAVQYAATFARHRIPFHPRSAVVRVLGDREVRGAVIAKLDAEGRPGVTREVEADLVAFGWGFTPSLDLPVALGAETRLGADGSLVVAVDDQQRTSVPGVRVAGEATGVGGALLARLEGELAARSLVAAANGQPLAVTALRRRIRRSRAFAHAMHAAHPVPPAWTQWLTDDTLVCRCEEVRVAAVRDAVEQLGAGDPRTVRSLTRVGMGRCQGRICADGCARLVVDLTHAPLSVDALRSTGRRTLAASLTLERMARLDAAVTEEIP